MRNIIKLALIAVVIISIACIALLFINGLSEAKTSTISPQTLFSRIDYRVNKEIVGKEYAEATKGYVSILDEIQTESSVTLSNGSQLVSVDEETKCRRKAFDVYCKIFIDYANHSFSLSSWDEKGLPAIKERAQQLLATRFAETGTEYDSNLKHSITVVDEYFAAWRVVRSAQNCTSVGSVNNIKKSAEAYKHSPLTNNSSLNSGLNNAFTTAKESFARYIKRYCDRVAQNYDKHYNYHGFLTEFNNASTLINSYIKNFGGESIFTQSVDKLNNADDNALTYYRQRDSYAN